MIIVPSILIVVFVLLIVGGKIHLRGMLLFYTEESMMYDELALMQPERDRMHQEDLANIQRQNEEWMTQHRLEHAAFMAEVASWYNTCTALVVHNGIYAPTFALSLAVAHQTDMQMKDYYIERDMHEMEE